MHLTVIAKSPVPGRVKTRLCPPCTHDEAAAVAAAALADTCAALAHVVSGSGTRLVLLVDGIVPPGTPRWFDVVQQRGDGLAARLANGFADLGPGFVIGMDAPEAVPFAVDGLRAVAGGHNAIGLCDDGGFWGVGLAATDMDPFSDVPMSVSTTGAEQVQRLVALGRPVTMLPTVSDIDNFGDLVALASRRSPWATRTTAIAEAMAVSHH